MGQVVEDILNGLCCQQCGVWMPDVFDDPKAFIDPPGYPRTCEDCEEENDRVRI